MKLAIIALAIGVAMPAYAQSTTEYYIVRDATTKKCTVVDQKPAASTTTTIVEDGKVYKSRTEADTAMKTVKVCTSD
ncbi:hypothetical protein PY365_29600 [Roseiarcaceae bacterium H3SJ34-1]|uniref:hypothetical protein n=1 Tax=Terripilifer ovatus TaxID=3032367 RepID=UPI003AB9A976|nr:hypothetical protein [Roseiarcaceae bacterium H3SJ34-1]